MLVTCLPSHLQAYLHACLPSLLLSHLHAPTLACLLACLLACRLWQVRTKCLSLRDPKTGYMPIHAVTAACRTKMYDLLIDHCDCDEYVENSQVTSL